MSAIADLMASDTGTDKFAIDDRGRCFSGKQTADAGLSRFAFSQHLRAPQRSKTEGFHFRSAGALCGIALSV
jgi:hypothetical protein